MPILLILEWQTLFHLYFNWLTQENKKQKEVAFSFSLHSCKFSFLQQQATGGHKGLPSQFCSTGTGFQLQTHNLA